MTITKLGPVEIVTETKGISVKSIRLKFGSRLVELYVGMGKSRSSDLLNSDDYNSKLMMAIRRYPETWQLILMLPVLHVELNYMNSEEILRPDSSMESCGICGSTTEKVPHSNEERACPFCDGHVFYH